MKVNEKKALLVWIHGKAQKYQAAFEKAELLTEQVFYKGKAEAFREMAACIESDHPMRAQHFRERASWRGKHEGR